MSGTTARAPLGGLWGLSRRLAAAAQRKYDISGSNRRIWGELRLRERHLRNAESDRVIGRKRRDHITRDNNDSARAHGTGTHSRIGDGCGGWWLLGRVRQSWRGRRDRGNVASSPRG
jgi:hypothetical protein